VKVPKAFIAPLPIDERNMRIKIGPLRLWEQIPNFFFAEVPSLYDVNKSRKSALCAPFGN
jgi:hypothetical protein